VGFLGLGRGAHDQAQHGGEDRVGPSHRPRQRRGPVRQGPCIFNLKKLRTTYELRTNQDGEAKVPEIPQGEIRIQVIAKGFQTFGQIFDVTEEEKTIDITLNPPQQQYSSHNRRRRGLNSGILV